MTRKEAQESRALDREMWRAMKRAEFKGLICRLLGHSREVEVMIGRTAYAHHSQCSRCFAPPFTSNHLR
jgi:hypothetical protein